ncbi:hypothetical protein P0082_11090 [Candidatus Haliotispira prima]|uniref:Uncharacterized protein n=1 Tax=Candidatus Haliotispira prima TaxID=3034016 RepID=A0ABY8MII4_9SPIO|nr:hypothetical protein P0082_11090 [Candidatus Haliotispira prima]
MFLFIFGCAPLSQTGEPPAAPSPTKSITVNYSGLHYVHFTANAPNISTDRTVGFLITPVTSTGSTLSKAVAETKKGYITRKFTETQKARAVFMFQHGGTAYDLAVGSTEVPFAAGGTASNTSFETSDILQENTSYKIRMYDGEEILEKIFTTKSFAAGDASSEGGIAYMGGLTAATKVAVPLTIERKPEEIMLLPYADDTYGGQQVNYLENSSSLRGGCSPNCGVGVSGAHIYALRKEANKLVSIVFIFSPQVKVTPTNWSAGEGFIADKVFRIEIISE